ncbi:MAG: hypothetical protein IT174_04595 [Acidobacteria bacterium]|nr:hypothetical protein [Acidobacteriota bacterium]
MNDVKLIIIVLMTFFVSAISVTGQSVYTPEKGSAERKAILDALRIPVERQLKQQIVFVADNFSVQGTWAFVSGTPQAPSGGAPDYSGTVFQEAKEAGAFDNNFFALLRKTGGKWRVVKYAIGCTDVCFVDWWRRYKAPKAIFPYTE